MGADRDSHSENIEILCPCGHGFEEIHHPEGGEYPCPACGRINVLPGNGREDALADKYQKGRTTVQTAPPIPEIKAGDLTGPYRITGQIGEGGDAVITRTFDASLHRIVAVKELKASGEALEDARRVFTREARLICFLDHPGVVPVFDHFVTSEEQPCYAMRLVEGESLAERVGFRPGLGCNPLPVAEAVGHLARVAETLAYAHDRGVIHLDLKPENLMIGRYGELLVMDWGNARLFDPAPYRAYLGEHASDEDVALLVDEPPDLLSGTPSFMSPEQTSRPRDQLAPSSDIFSAGVLSYLLLTGRLPFRAKDIPTLLVSIREDTPAPLRDVNPQVPRRLAEIVDRMLEKDPNERYPSFAAVLEDLRLYQDAGQGFPIVTLEPGAILFAEDDEGDDAYVIISGRIAISKQTPEGDRVLAELGPGEIFGELAILSRQPRTASARAVERTTLRRMDRAAVEQELGKIPPWVAGMVSTLAQRFIDVNEQLAKQPDASD